MVPRTRKKINLAWLDYAPQILVWGQVKRLLARYKLTADFKRFIKGVTVVYEGNNGDLKHGYLSVDLKRFLRSRLKARSAKKCPRARCEPRG